MTETHVLNERIAAPAAVWQTGLLAAAVAAIGNLLVYALASALGVSFNVTPPAMGAPPFALMVVLASVIGVLAGTLVFTLMPRFSRRPVSRFRTIALVVLVVSFVQPLMLATGFLPTAEPVGLGTIVALELMHVVAGLATITLLTTRARAG